MNSDMVLNHQTAYHCSAQQLTSLLGLDESAWSEPSPDDLRGILTHQLDAPLLCDPGDETVVGAAGESSGEWGGGKGGREGDWGACSIRQVLEAPSPPVDLLRLIKAFARRHIDGDGRAEAGGGSLPRDVALVLYYLSIAAARCAHGTRISHLADADLDRGLTWCVRRSWLDADSRHLIETLRGRRRSSRLPEG